MRVRFGKDPLSSAATAHFISAINVAVSPFIDAAAGHAATSLALALLLLALLASRCSQQRSTEKLQKLRFSTSKLDLSLWLRCASVICDSSRPSWRFATGCNGSSVLRNGKFSNSSASSGNSSWSFLSHFLYSRHIIILFLVL